MPRACRVGTKKILARVVVECEHADRVADAKRAMPERFDERRCHFQLRARGAEAHRRGHIDDGMHGHGHALPVHAHEPFALHAANACAHIDPAWIGMIEQPRVRRELLADADARPAMPAGPRTRHPHGKPVLELRKRVHGAAILETICVISASESSWRRNS